MTEAAETAQREAEVWAAIAERWRPGRNREIWADLPASEAHVIPGADVQADLERRGLRWGYRFDRGDLSELAVLAAALAQAEAEGWEAGDGPIATQAYEDRRFLAADRVVPWAVPWLRAVARCFPDNREAATSAAEALLELGERHRLAPSLAGSEGLVAPGHDGYGPADQPAGLSDRIGSLWGGMVVFDRSVRSITGRDTARVVGWRPEADERSLVVNWYEVAAARWDGLAARCRGTAQYWIDLANRSRRTAQLAEGA